MKPQRIQLRFQRSRRKALPPRRGAIFVIALAIIIILSGLVLVFAQEMRTEATTSANRLAYVQAEAIEQGAEQWVLAQVESYAPDAVTLTQQTPAEAIQIGDGYFRILSPDPTQNQDYNFAITDETSKIDLSTAQYWPTPPTLPNMTADIVSSIIDWQSTSDTTDPNGAGNSYYQSLQEPYSCKAAPFESVDELLLIRNLTPQILFGFDLNHDGVIDTNEQNLANQNGQQLSGDLETGIFNYVTCFSSFPVSAGGSTGTGTTGGIGSSTTTSTALVNVNSAQLQTVLTTALGAGKAGTYMANLQSGGGGGRGGRGGGGGGGGGAQSFTSMSQFFTASQMTASDYGLVADQLTASATARPLLNVNTASSQALACLPGLVQADGDAIVAARSNASLTDMSWFFTALQSTTKVASVADFVTDKSYQYSADIVAVSGDGRAFKRVRIVVDASKYPTTPAQIIYRKDLTSLGWPLPPEIRQSMRAGHGVPETSTLGGGGLGGNSSGMGMNSGVH